MPTISVICSTYNEPLFLEMVLNSFLKQSFIDFELLIADDGSAEETQTLIDRYQEKADFPIVHCWHEDQGYRKAEIHNIAIEKAKGAVFVFIDGDVVVDPDFLLDHHQMQEEHKGEKAVVMGRRIELGPKLTETLTVANIESRLLKRPSFPLIKSCFDGDSKNFLRSYSVKNSFFRKILKADNVENILGCNFSVTRESIYQVNGFNENFQAYWGEDGDLFIRLRNLGCKLIGRKYYAVQYHLYHTRRPVTEEHEETYHRMLKDWDYKWCEKGLTHSVASTSEAATE